MKIHFSLPKDEGFFNSYATLTPTLYKLGFLAQVVSALTEIGIIYSLVYSSLADFFPGIAHLAALFGAVVGTAFLEIGLRKFIPYSFRAILYKRFQELHLVMSVFIFAVAIGLLFSSGLLSFKGSKDLVAAVTPPANQQTTIAIDSLFRQQSASIQSRFDGQASALQEQYKALSSVQQLQLEKYQEREKRTGRSYISRKNRINEQLAALAAQKASKLAELEHAKANSLALAEQRLLQGMKKVEAINDNAKVRSEQQVRRYGNGLAWFTIVCLSVLVLSIALDEVHKKGSGIEAQALPNQYHFSQSISKELATMFSDKWNYFTRSWIRRQADLTPVPLHPPPLPILYDLEGLQSQRVKVSFQQLIEAREQPLALNTSLGGYDQLFESAVAGDDTSSVLSRAVVKGFVQSPTEESTEQPTDANAMHYITEEKVVFKKEAEETKGCKHCGQAFKPRTTWQKYCSVNCRANFHAEKHGQPFNPRQYHKAKKKKDSDN